MFKPVILCLSLFVSCIGQAGVTKSFTDNNNIDVELSKSNYNRIVVKNDTITQGYYPEKTLAFKAVADGSAYIDILKDKPVTLFIDTKGGHHFSLTIKAVEGLGQTIVLTPETAGIKKAANFEKKSPYEETITKLIHSAMNNEAPSGYGIKTAFTGFKSFNKNLSIKTKKQFIGNQFTAEIIQIYNKTSKVQPLYESWFKGTNTRAIAFSQSKLSAKKSALMYVVRENSNV